MSSVRESVLSAHSLGERRHFRNSELSNRAVMTGSHWGGGGGGGGVSECMSERDEAGGSRMSLNGG